MLSTRELKRQVLIEGAGPTTKKLRYALKKKKLTASDFSLRGLAEAFVLDRHGRPVGREWVDQMNPGKSGLLLRESVSAVNTTHFLNITGQIVFNKVMEGYQQEEFIGDTLVETIPTKLNGEKIPGVTGYTDNVESIEEMMPYPQTGFGEDWVETPSTKKYGEIVAVTKEAIFFDKTGLVLTRASQLGELIARAKEKRILDVVLGITNNYKWRGTSYNTYLTSGAWINAKSGVTITDWNSIDTAEQLFSDMTEPNTGEPIVINPNTILHMPAKKHLFRQIVRATSLELRTQSSAQGTWGANTVDNYRLISSKFAKARLVASGVSAANAALYWYLGDFKRAFVYMQNWGLQVVQAPDNSEAEFTQDITLRWKASERGVAAVRDPRYVVKIYNS